LKEKFEANTHSPRPVAPIPSASNAVKSLETRTPLAVVLCGDAVEEYFLHASAGRITAWRHAGRKLKCRTSSLQWPSPITDIVVDF
jgi:hypothetical protein